MNRPGGCLCLYEWLDCTETWARIPPADVECPEHPPPKTLGRMIRPGLDNDYREPTAVVGQMEIET